MPSAVYSSSTKPAASRSASRPATRLTPSPAVSGPANVAAGPSGRSTVSVGASPSSPPDSAPASSSDEQAPSAAMVTAASARISAVVECRVRGS